MCRAKAQRDDDIVTCRDALIDRAARFVRDGRLDPLADDVGAKLSGRALGELRFDTLASQPPSAFVEALARGRPLYAAQTLRDYVQDDLRLLAAHRPDAVIGDFRLSLSISAGHARFPMDGRAFEELLAVADERMYRDKAGRRARTARHTGHDRQAAAM